MIHLAIGLMGTFGKGDKVVAKMNADDMKLRWFEYGAAWDAG